MLATSQKGYYLRKIKATCKTCRHYGTEWCRLARINYSIHNGVDGLVCPAWETKEE